MYFIQHGVVEVQKEDVKDPIKQLADGCYFGGQENALPWHCSTLAHAYFIDFLFCG